MMKRTILLISLTCWFCLTSAQKQSKSLNFKANEILVQINKNFKTAEIEKQFSAYELKVDKQISASLDAWKLSFNPDKINIDELVVMLQNETSILVAQVNHKVYKRQTFPNDNVPWQFHNANGTDADVDAPEAWDFATGGYNADGDRIVIAVIDGEFDHTDPDIDFWTNTAEAGGQNGIDDDNNGWVDDYKGWDSTLGHGYLTDGSGHGQFVLRVAGRLGNNSYGDTGLNWNCQIMSIQIFNDTTTISYEDRVIEAFDYVVSQRNLYDQTNGAQGAYIVATNNSYGTTALPSTAPLWCAAHAIAGAQGILSAGATNNNYSNVDVVGDLPTACSEDHLITVTNTTNIDTWSDSGYGTISIDLGSPSNGSTSEATPIVAGLVALMHAAMCPTYLAEYKNNPSAIALQLKDYILNGVDPMPDLQGITVTGGRVNAYNALALMLNDQCNIAFPPIASFSADTTTICVGESIQFTDESQLNPSAWQWNFSGGTPVNSNNPNPIITYNTPGVFDVQLSSSNIHGNHSFTLYNFIEVINPTGVALPYQQDFETGNDWNIDIGTDPTNWMIQTGDLCNGSVMAVDNFGVNNTGTADQFSLSFDLTNISNAQLTFDIAYAQYNDTYFDALEIWISGCSINTTPVFYQSGSNLASAPNNTEAFIPQSCDDWKTEIVDLSAFSGQVITLTFENQSNWGNWMYIDNIEIGSICNLNLSIVNFPTSTFSTGPIALTGSPSGGTFSGPGVLFNAFNPSVTGAGLHTITYQYTDTNTDCIAEVSATILVGTINYNFVSYNLGTITP